MDAVEAAVGDRAGVGDRELAGALAAADRARGPVPDQPRAQLGEPLRRVAAVEHVEHVLELLAREVARRARPAVTTPLDLVDLPLVVGDHRDEVLGEDVERVAGDHRLLDLAARASAWRPPRTRAGRRGTSGRSGPSRPRRAGGRRGRPAAGPAATDFGDSTWITRSTAPMSMPSSSEEVATRQGSLPGLEQLLDHERAPRGRASRGGRGRSPRTRHVRRLARAARPAASLRTGGRVAPRVLGGRELLVGSLVVELVQALGEPLGAAAVVDEDDRRGVLADELEQLRVDRRPDRARVGAGSSDRRRDRARELDPVRRGRAAAARSPSGGRGAVLRARSCRRPGRRSRGRAPCGRRR